MSGTQVILAVVAMSLLTLSILTTSRSSYSHNMELQVSKIGIFRVSIASSILEEVRTQVFDEIMNDTVVLAVGLSDFVPPGRLGLDFDETHPGDSTILRIMDDVDDIDSLSWNQLEYGVDRLTVIGRVSYGAISGNRFIPVNTTTFNKIISIRVLSSLVDSSIGIYRDTVSLQTVKGFY